MQVPYDVLLLIRRYICHNCSMADGSTRSKHVAVFGGDTLRMAAIAFMLV